MDLWKYENELASQGYELICGADEAGAGPLAGPVYAAAVVLPFGLEIPDLNDSKKLSAKKRDALYDIIIEKAVSWCVSSVDEKTIDEINILNARMLAMDKAIKGLSVTPDIALIDGNRSGGIECNNITIVGGDGKSANIAAASILAKVSRDRFMLKIAEQYPEYGFEKHKGYGTKLHYEMIEKYGVLPIHRKTFLKKFFEESGK